MNFVFREFVTSRPLIFLAEGYFGFSFCFVSEAGFWICEGRRKGGGGLFLCFSSVYHLSFHSPSGIGD